MSDEKQSLPPQSNGDLVPIDQSLSSLDRIQESLYEKMRLAETPEEVQRYLNLIKQRQEQIEQREYTNFQLQESKNQINYERKLALYKESLTVVFSVTSIVLGISTISSIPLIAPFLIILGLIKPLGYSISEVVELLRILTPSAKSSKEEIINKKEDGAE